RCTSTTTTGPPAPPTAGWVSPRPPSLRRCCSEVPRHGERPGQRSSRLIFVSDVAAQVTSCDEAARAGARNLATAPDKAINVAPRGMAALLTKAAATVLAANAADLADGAAAGLGRGLLDRLRLDEARIAEMARQISLLAASPFPPAQQDIRELPGGFFLAERRGPGGVVGAHHETRPHVTVGVGSQLPKARPRGVRRTRAPAGRAPPAPRRS